VERCAADALGQHPDWDNIRPLLNAHHRIAADDTHLLYVVRMSLRNQLQAGDNISRLPLPEWSDVDEKAVADICPALPSAGSARFLLQHLAKYTESTEKADEYLRKVARYLPEAEIPKLVDFTREKFANDVDFQLALFKSVQDGL